MEDFKILIIGSSDFESTDPDKRIMINLNKDIQNIKLPCNKFNKPKNNLCSFCGLTSYDHKIGYPYTPPPLNPTIYKDSEMGISFKSPFSDLYQCKYMIFEKIKSFFINNKNYKKFNFIWAYRPYI
jgi:hypothetical protein